MKPYSTKDIKSYIESGLPDWDKFPFSVICVLREWMNPPAWLSRYEGTDNATAIRLLEHYGPVIRMMIRYCDSAYGRGNYAALTAPLAEYCAIFCFKNSGNRDHFMLVWEGKKLLPWREEEHRRKWIA